MNFDLNTVLPRTENPDPCTDPHDVYLMLTLRLTVVLDQFMEMLPPPLRSFAVLQQLGYPVTFWSDAFADVVNDWLRAHPLEPTPELLMAFQKAHAAMLLKLFPELRLAAPPGASHDV